MNLKDSYLHGTDSQALIRALKWENGVLKYQEASESQPWKEITGFASGNYLPLNGGTMSGNIILPTNTSISNGSTADGFSMLFWNGTDTVLGSTHGNTIIRNNSGALKHRIGYTSTTEYDILDSGNSSVSLSGQTLSVKINGTTQSLTNTWRGIQDNLTSTSIIDSLSAKQGKILNEKFNNYLPLTGGTVTGATTFDQAINADILGNATTSDRVKNAITFTGYQSKTYDGSAAITIAIPNNTNQLTNGAGFITSSANITGTAAGITGYSFKTLSAVGTSGWTNYDTDSRIIPTMSFIAYWNGAHSSTSSNLAYCNQGAFGSATTHAHSDYVTGLSISGNTLAWSKGGTAQTALTIPYATKASTADGISCPGFNTFAEIDWNGVKSYQGGGGTYTDNTNNPTYAYAAVLRVGSGLSRGWELHARRGATQNLYWRNPNDDQTTWGDVRTILDSYNSSVSKSGQTLTVKINGSSQSLTNTWPTLSDLGGQAAGQYVNYHTKILEPNKGIRITYPTFTPIIIGANRSNGSGQLVLIGSGYGEQGIVRNRFTEVVSCSTSLFTWSLPNSQTISNSIEIMHTGTGSNATVIVYCKGDVTFTDITALTTPAQNHTLAKTSDIPTTMAWTSITGRPTSLSEFTDDLGSSPTHTHAQYATIANVYDDSGEYRQYLGKGGTNNTWVRTTSQGIIPNQSGGATNGHASLGSSSWYFANAYIQNIYGFLNGNISGSANSLSSWTGASDNDTTWRYIWMSYNDNSGKACYDPLIAYRTSDDTLKVPNILLSGNVKASTGEIDSLTAGNLVVQGTSSLGTVTSGTWNGDRLTASYLPTDVVYTGTTQTLTNKTISTGSTYQGDAIADTYIASAATWNGKQDKVAAKGSVTKPVYVSSAGVFSECNEYPTKASWNYDDVYSKLGHTHTKISTTSFSGQVDGTVSQYKTNIHDTLKNLSGIGTHIVVSDSIIISWGNNSASHRPSSVSSIININGGYDGNTYGQFLVASWSQGLGILKYSSGFDSIKWLSTTDHTHSSITDGTTTYTVANITSIAVNASNGQAAYDALQLANADIQGTIDRWDEVVSFLANISEGSNLASILQNYVTTNTTQTISGNKTFTGASTFSQAINGDLLGTATQANRWSNTHNFTIKDSDNTNSGTATAVDGSTDYILHLPSTIKANITGNVSGSAGSVLWTNVSGRPTNVSSFTNDAGYITTSSSITGTAADITGYTTVFSMPDNSTKRWVRLVSFNTYEAAGQIQLTNGYWYNANVIVVLDFGVSYTSEWAFQLDGRCTNTNYYSKARIVWNNTEHKGYLEVESVCRANSTHIKASRLQGCTLISTYTEGSVPDGYTVAKEIELVNGLAISGVITQNGYPVIDSNTIGNQSVAYSTYLTDGTNNLSYSSLSGVASRTVSASTAGYMSYYSDANTIVGTGLLTVDTTNSKLTSTGTLVLGNRVSSSAQSSVTRLTLTPYFHTGGPWHLQSLDDSSNAYIRWLYGSTEVWKLKHDGTLYVPKTIQGSVSGSSGSCTGNAATATNAYSNTFWINGPDNSAITSAPCLTLHWNNRTWADVLFDGTLKVLSHTDTRTGTPVPLLVGNITTSNINCSGNIISSFAEIDSLTAGNLVVQGTSSLGTITSGIWNGIPIANDYLENKSITINGTSVNLGGSITVSASANGGTSDYAKYLRGRQTNGTYYDSSAVNNIIAEWNTKSDNRWYLKAASTYECRVEYATNADTVDSLHIHTGRNNEINKLVRTDNSGYIQAGWINTTSGGFNGTAASTLNKIYCSEDDYVRYLSPVNFQDAMSAKGTHNFSATNYNLSSVSWTSASDLTGYSGTFVIQITDTNSTTQKTNYYSGVITINGTTGRQAVEEIPLSALMATGSDTEVPTRIYAGIQQGFLKLSSQDSSEVAHNITVKILKLIAL